MISSFEWCDSLRSLTTYAYTFHVLGVAGMTIEADRALAGTTNAGGWLAPDRREGSLQGRISVVPGQTSSGFCRMCRLAS